MSIDYRREPGRPGKDEAPAPSKRVGVFIPLQILAQLERIALERRITRHAAIREALAEYVEHHGAK
jgi:metal-responsive CopG/Arc/MetJ family transcriptional regulator